ncbi:MAG: hypothetical protein JSS49_22505 [Planctomycetes bacterium]|nr:hypothetical protein [Planctomycetota bacterium]
MKRLILEIACAVVACVLFGCWYCSMRLPAIDPAPTDWKITGPATVSYPGQFVQFHVDIPGKDPTAFNFVWAVESLTTLPVPEPMTIAGRPGEVQFLTVPGRWRLNCAVWDPGTKAGRMLTREITVPGSAIPDQKPKPPPSPGPDPPPAPAGRFDQFATDVRGWLAEVKSPAKATEAQTLAADASRIAARCRDSKDLGQATGLYLEGSVLTAVRSANVAAVKAHPDDWKQFGTKVSTWVGQAIDTKQLVTAADYAELLDAFAKGLKE